MPQLTRVPTDLSRVRGFNYQSAATKDHTDHWLNYNPADTDFELDLAKRINLNQVRLFIAYPAYEQDRRRFLGNLLHFMRASQVRDLGVMITLMYPRDRIFDRSAWPSIRGYAEDLVQTLSPEPALAFWDVSNEPDWHGGRLQPEERRTSMDHARYMADLFHELDPITPVTIGSTFVPAMIEMAEAVDVLSFHDYSTTRLEIRRHIAEAKRFAAQVGKPVFNTEIGCICRANPYDVTLEEHMRANVGWYIWELMVTGQWGSVHGVFYQDGTVRDPSVLAAVMGFFRKRDAGVVPAEPDREGYVTRVVDEIETWLAQPEPQWEAGLDEAEAAAHLLEAAELVPMRELPTRAVDRLRAGSPDATALRALLEDHARLLKPYRTGR